MQKFLKLSIRLGIVLAIALLALPALAATIAVDGTTDGTDCTLADAIENANNDNGDHTECTAGSGADTINIAAGLTIELSSASTISSEITINGNGSTVDIPTGGGGRLFKVDTAGTLTINGLSLIGVARADRSANGGAILSEGTLTVNNSRFESNQTGDLGGAIYHSGSGSLTVFNTSFVDNSAEDGGGGIYATSTGTIKITRSTFEGSNSVDATNGSGGALHINGSATIANSHFNNNGANTTDGGVIHIAGGTVSLQHLTILGGSLGSGAKTGLRVAGGTVTLENSIIHNITIDPASASPTPGTACEGTLSSSVGNLISGTNNCSAVTASTADPDLSDNNGDDIYIPDSNTSPVVDAVDCLSSVTDDYFGETRPQDGNDTDDNSDGVDTDECDIGAVELAGTPPVATGMINVNTASFGVFADGECSLEEALANARNGAQTYTDCDPGRADADGSDTINIAAGLVINVTTGFQISRDTVINGNGSTLQGVGTTLFAINNTGAAQTIQINNLILQNGNGGTAGANGGAINISASTQASQTLTVTFSNVSFINNQATAGTNTAGAGGALYVVGNGNAVLTIINSTFSGNSGAGEGKAIYFDDGTLTMQHVTITDSGTQGGGDAGSAVVLKEAAATIQNSIITDSVGVDCEADSNSTVTGTGNLIQSDHATNPCGVGDITGDAMLQALSGGVHALGTGSAAIDAVNCIGITTDQVGNARPQDDDGDGVAQCDAGAIEGAVIVPTPTATPDPGDGGGDDDMMDDDDDGDDGAGDDMMDDDADDDDGDGAGSADDTPRRRRAKATPAPTRTPVPTKPLGQVLNEQGYQITAATGMHSGVQFKVVDGAGVGNDAVIARGFVDAIDVFGWVSQGVTVCFKQLGAVVFLDADNSPRTAEDIASYATADGRTCVDLNRAGTLVLVHGSPTTAAMPAGTSGLQNCMVTLTEILNFRDGPGGDIMGILPAGVTLTALERTSEWFHVDYHGRQGWISANYVTENGTCS